MKKLLVSLMTIATLVTLTACGNDSTTDSTTEVVEESNFTWSEAEQVRNTYTYVITDQETGVEYIVVKYSGFKEGGITMVPRYNADGSLCTAD